MENIKASAKKHFSTHPKIDTFFITSDLQAFFTVNDARNHGKGLKDSSVIKVLRDSRTTEDTSQDLVSKVVYLDKEDEQQIENIESEKTAKVVITEKSASEKQANKELEEFHNGKEGDASIKTDAEKSEIIEEDKKGTSQVDKKDIDKKASEKK